MTKPTKYQAFISYSHLDHTHSQRLQKILERIGRPFYFFGKRKITVFRDETDMALSSSLSDSILDALKKSDYFIIMASRKAAASTWVNEEVKWWREQKSGDKILIVQVQGDLVWATTDFDWTVTNCLPPALAKCFTKEPLYLDWRNNTQKRRLRFFNRTSETAPVVQLAARLLDQPTRTVARTEARTLSRIIGFSLLIFLSFLILGSNLISSKQKNRISDASLAQANKEAFHRRVQLARDSIDGAMSDASAYLAANLDTFALQTYTYAYTIAINPAYDTVTGFDSIRTQCNRKIHQIKSDLKKPSQ